MKHLKLFEEFLNAQYESVETCKTREDCLKKFGKKLFAKKFSWLPWSEKNTNIEDKLIELIDKFTGHNHGKSTNPEFITLLKDLSNCMSFYPSILKPQDRPIYRGTTITLRTFLMSDIEDDVTITGYNYKPNSPISSWSSKLYVAENFADKYESLNRIILGKIFDGNEFWTQSSADEIEQYLSSRFNKQILDERFGIILKADKPDNTFLFNSSYFRKLSGMESEHELLKITNDPIKVTIIPYMNEKYISQIKLVLDILKTFL